MTRYYVAAKAIITAEIARCGNKPPHILIRHINAGMCRDTFPHAGHLFVFRGRRADLLKIVRTERSRPLVDDLRIWLREQRSKLSSKADLAKAIGYMLSRWHSFARFLEDGRVCGTNNAAERAIRPLAVGRRNWTFAGADAGGRRAAAMYTMIETALCRARHRQVYAAR